MKHSFLMEESVTRLAHGHIVTCGDSYYPLVNSCSAPQSHRAKPGRFHRPRRHHQRRTIDTREHYPFRQRLDGRLERLEWWLERPTRPDVIRASCRSRKQPEAPATDLTGWYLAAGLNTLICSGCGWSADQAVLRQVFTTRADPERSGDPRATAPRWHLHWATRNRWF